MLVYCIVSVYIEGGDQTIVFLIIHPYIPFCCGNSWWKILAGWTLLCSSYNMSAVIFG